MSSTATGAVAQRIGHEAQRYLAVVEAFRAEGCQPRWRSEPTSSSRLLRPPEGRKSC